MTDTPSIQIRIRPYSDELGAYPVEVTLDDGSQFLAGEFRLDEQALLVNELDAQAYGLLLFNALFSGPTRRAYDKATGRADALADGALRMRLWIDDRAPRLHAIPWERLYHIQRGQITPLTISGLTPFSRYTGLEAGEPPPLSRQPVSMLVSIANPTDLPQGMAEIDVAGEVQALADALGDLTRNRLLRVAILPGRTGLSAELRSRLEGQGYSLLDGPTTLDAILRGLEQADLWHHLGHGLFKADRSGAGATAWLFLEQEDGAWLAAKDSELASRLAALRQPPHLIFLAACDSAKRDEVHPFVGLAPQLVQAGVPAVVAMQERVPMEVARKVTADFYRRLFEHGEVDLALNQARLLLFEAQQTTWSIPVLYSRLVRNELIELAPDEALWRTDQMMAATQQLLDVVKQQAPEQVMMDKLESILQQWRDSHAALVRFESELRRLPDDPTAFAPAFGSFYDGFKDYYNGQTWVTEEGLIRAVLDLQRTVLPQLQDQIAPETYAQISDALAAQVGIRGRLLAGFDEILERMNSAVDEMEALVNAGQAGEAIARKHDFLVQIAADFNNSRRLLRQISGQVTTVASLLTTMKQRWANGQALSSQQIVSVMAAQGDARQPLEAITQALMTAQGIDASVLKQPGAAQAAGFVDVQIGEVMAAQQTAEDRGMATSPQALHRLGMLAAYRRDYDAALRYFRQATQADPTWSEPFESIAWLQQSLAHEALRLRRPDDARQRLDEARTAAGQADPLDPQVLALRGYIAHTMAQVAEVQGNSAERQKYLEEAARMFQNVLRLEPDDPSARNGLGNVEAERGNLDAAIAAYQKAIQLAPGYASAHHDLAIAYEGKMQADPQNARSWGEAALGSWQQAQRLAAKDPGFTAEAVAAIGARIVWLQGFLAK